MSLARQTSRAFFNSLCESHALDDLIIRGKYRDGELPLIHPKTNRLLEALSPDLRRQLAPMLQAGALPKGHVLFESNSRPRYAHFITSGMASTVATLRDGTVVEVGVTGYEGFPEKFHLLGRQTGRIRCFMQIEGSALRMDLQRLEDLFHRDEPLRRIIFRLIQNEALWLSQLSACNRMHEVRERLARWLLMVQDRTMADDLKLTQELLAEMLGARRSTVNMAMSSLEEAGLILHRRSRVRIIDRGGLESVACECYKVVQALLENLYE